MKTKVIVSIASLIAISAMCYMTTPFGGWDWLESHTHFIIVARCGSPTPITERANNAPAFDSSIEILSMLKGTNSLSSVRLETQHELRQGEYYVAFGYFDSFDTNVFMAYEDYRVIPLGRQFSTNLIAGKTLDEQLQVLFRQAADKLNRKIQNDEAEKQRLESGIRQ